MGGLPIAVSGQGEKLTTPLQSRAQVTMPAVGSWIELGTIVNAKGGSVKRIYSYLQNCNIDIITLRFTIDGILQPNQISLYDIQTAWTHSQFFTDIKFKNSIKFEATTASPSLVRTVVCYFDSLLNI